MFDMSAKVLGFKAKNADQALGVKRDLMVLGVSSTAKGDMLFCRPEHRDVVAVVVIMWNMHQTPGFRDALITKRMGPEAS